MDLCSSPDDRGWYEGGAAPQSVVELITSRVMDAELAAVLWLLIEGDVPLLVAGDSPVGRSAVLGALLDLLPLLTGRVDLDAGSIPEAGARSGAGGTWLVARDLVDGAAAPRAREAIRAVHARFGLAATLGGDSLEDVMAALASPPVGATEDEVRSLGAVLIVRSPAEAPDRARRVVAAHYLRPAERDAQGHIQRRPPAVLAAWDARTDTHDDFAWGITAELAARVGRPAAGFEEAQRDRAAFLRALDEAGIDGVPEVRRAILGYREPSANRAPD